MMSSLISTLSKSPQPFCVYPSHSLGHVVDLNVLEMLVTKNSNFRSNNVMNWAFKKRFFLFLAVSFLLISLVLSL